VALGWINDQNSRYGIIASVGLGIAGFVFLLFGKLGIAVMTGGGFLFGWAYAGVTVETALLVRSVFGGKDYAKIFSNISIALAAGGALMAGGWGYLTDLIDFKFVLSSGIVLLVSSGILGFYALWKSKQFRTNQ
jgi:hypothetical protein